MDEIDHNQNLKKIQYISAKKTGSVMGVLNVMTQCEDLRLNPEQADMGRDILDSINGHDESERRVAAWYLIRYGMLLANENKNAALDAANTQGGQVDQEITTPVSTSNDSKL